MRIRSILALFLLLLISTAAFAQQGTSQLKGKVVGPDGSALPGVTVTIKHQDSGVVRTTISDKDGVYVMSAVTPGVYEMTAELSGFKNFRRRNIRLEVGKTATVDVNLTMGGVSEEVTVTAAAPIVDVTSKEVGGNITSKELTELPSINRNFHRLHRIASRRRTEHQHGIVRRGLGERQRTGPAQQQLHVRRRQQQR